MPFSDTSQIDSAINAIGGNATLENSYLAANAKNSSEEEVMYFLIGAIVSTIVLVIYSQSFPLLHYCNFRYLFSSSFSSCERESTW